MRRNIFILYFILSFCFPGYSGINGTVWASERVTPSGLQKPDKKKTKKEQNGQSEVTLGNAGMLIDAKKEAIIGNLKGAQDLFRQYINRYAEDPVGYFELARLEAEQKNFDEAGRLCREACKLDPDNIWYSLFLAELCQGTAQITEAISIYEKVIDKNPGNLDYLYQLAALYLQVEKYPDAIKTYNLIDEKAGVSEEIALQKQKIYLHLNDQKSAEREIQKLIAAFPDEPRYYSILAEFYMSNNMQEKALETYQKIAVMEPDNAYIHMSMADYYRKSGNKEKSFEELKLGFANPNLDVDTKVNILLSFYTVNQIYNDLKDQAFILSKILIETHPKDPKVFSIYGDLLVQDKKLPEAREAFLKVLSLDSSRYAVWEQVLQLDLQLNELDHLLTYSTKASELFPDQPLPFLFTGLADLQLKKNEAALKALAAGANLVVDNNELLAQFYMYQGDALHAMKNEAEAFMAYERSLKLKDDNSYVLNNYAYYLALDGSQLEKAERMSKKAVTLDSLNASFQDTYGWVLFKQKKYREAAGWILKAVQSNEEPSTEVLEHYGDVLYHLGDTTGALEYWIKAKKKGTGSLLLDKKIDEKKYYQ
jgi:predicted Zn-dependent protease